MDDKKNARLTVGFFCLLLLVITIADFLTGDRVYSENENRLLASRPEISREAVQSGQFMEEYEEYVTDQFVGRDTWIMLKTRGDILLQKKDINGVYLGADGYLLEQHLPQDFPAEQAEKKIALLEKLVEDYDARVMLVPTADNIISDKLPANAQYYDETELLRQVEKAVGERNVIDVYSALKEHSRENIYYRTDHHWTSLGAYYAYLEWAEQRGRIPYPYDTANMETVTDSFLGTLHSRLNLPMEGDAIQIFPETKKRPVKVTYDLRVEADTMYKETYLNTKNKYGYFLDDNHALVEIETGYHNAKELFLIKDSYANCFVPLLTPHYEKIYMVDLRYYNGKLSNLIEQYQTEKGMDVMVLYNCIHFLEDFQYY